MSKHLLAESNSGTPVRAQQTNLARKNRRQSVYDDNRRLSLWEKFQNAETQTDANSETCACCDLREKLKKITTELKIKECKINNMERMAAANPLKFDLQQAQADLDKERRAHAKTKESVDEANRKIAELTNLKNKRTGHTTRSIQVGMSMSEYIEKVKRKS